MADISPHITQRYSGHSLREKLEPGTTEHSLMIWLDGIDHDIAALEATVKVFRRKAEKLLNESIALKEKIRSQAVDKGEQIMKEREKALEDNPF